MHPIEAHHPGNLLRKLVVAFLALATLLVALGALNASAAHAGTLVITKGGDRNTNSNSFSGATNYAQNLSGAQFEYSTSASGPWTAISGSTGANGQISTSLPGGTYFVRERAAATGFTNFGPVTSLSFNNGSQPYVARVQVSSGSGTTYAYPHSNSDSNPNNWTPTNSSSSYNNGSPFLDVRDNGTVQNSCGQNILLVLDRSGSIDPYRDSYEEAAKAFVNQLNGTPTQIGIVSFNDDVNSYSPSQGSSNYYHSPVSLSNSGSASSLNSTISNVYNNPNGTTNWDGALQAAAAAKGFTADASTGQTTNPDMVVFITDGNPTTSEIGGGGGGNNTTLSDISGGIASANLVKTQDSRPGKKVKLLAIGVGSGVTASNLSVVSGPTQGVNGDYAVPTIPELDSFLQELAAAQCGARIYVRKRIAGDNTNANQPNWKYTAVDPRSGHTPTYLDNNNATHPSGTPPVIQTGAFFTNLPTTSTTVQMNENATGQPVSNFSLTGVVCRKGGYDSGTAVGGTQSGLNFSLNVSRGDEIYCTYTNAVNTTLSINKTPDNQTINAGDDAEFTITVQNTGGNTATSALVSDQLPAAGVGGWTVSQQPSGGNCSVNGSNLLGCTLGDLPAGATRTIKVKTGTDKDHCATYDNPAAKASASNASEVSDGGKITCQKPSLEVTKSATNSPINAGDDAGFSITLKNNGPGIAKGATLHDPLPSGTAGSWTIGSQPAGNPCQINGQTLSCSFGDLASGQSRTVTVKAPTSAQSCTTYDNTATGAATNAANATDTAKVVCQTAGLGVLKTAVSATINAGDTASFTIVTSNTGAGTAKGVTLSDPLPTGVSGPWTITNQPAGNPCSITAGVLNCNFGDLDSGASRSVTVSAPTDFQSCTKLDNTASAASTNAPGATDSASIQCQKPNLSVTKTATSGTINAGDTAKFTIKVANSGPGTAKAVTLSDPLPSGNSGWVIDSQPAGNPCSITSGTLNCSFGDLNAGSDRQVVVSLATSSQNCSVYDNTATAHSSNAPDASDNAKITCQKPGLKVTKNAANGTISAGDDAQFSITLANDGMGTAKGATLSDPLPSGVSGAWTIVSQPSGNPCSISSGTLSCSFGDLASGQSRTVTVKAATSYQACVKLDNTATGKATNAPDATDSASITCQKPSVSVDKSAAHATINAGDDAEYSITMKNNGPGTAKGATLSDPLPSGVSGAWTIVSQPSGNPCSISSGTLSCSFGDLASGQSRTVTVKAATSYQACVKLDNTATGKATNAPDATDSASITCQKAGLKVTKTAADGTINAGDDVQFQIKVENNGSGAAQNVKLSDPLPGGTMGAWTIVSQPAGNPCSITGGTLSCDFGSLASGASQTVTVRAATGYDACTIYDNTATATSTNAPSATDSAKVTCEKPNLTTLKTAVQGTISAGDNAQFTIKVTNSGPGTASGATLSDPLPAGVSGTWTITSQPAGNPCSIAGGVLTCDFGDLAAGQTREVTVSAPTSYESCSTLENTATASSENSPDAPGSATIECQKPSLNLTKTAADGTINAGEDAQFSMTLKNDGPGTAKGATLSDPLPSGVASAWTIVSQPSGNPCSITSGTLSCDFGDLAAGQERTVSVKASTSAHECTTYDNTATAKADNAPDATDSASVKCETATVGVLKTAVHGTINAGENAEFTIETSNTGAGTAKDVVMTDTLPTGVSGAWTITDQPTGDPCSITAGTLTCDFGDLESGASRSVTVSAPTDFESCTTLDNTASATSSNADGDSGQASIYCQKPNLSVTKTASSETINAGEDAEFTITVANAGPGTAKGVTLNDPLPSGTAGAWTITDQPDGNPCSISSGTLTCDFGDLAAGEDAQVSVTAPTSYESCTVYDNTATVSSSNAPDATDEASISCEKPDLAALKTAVQGTINAGDNAQFTIEVSNSGPGVAKGVTLDDPLPAGVSGDWSITDQPDGNPCSISEGSLICDFGDLSAEQSVSVTVSAPTDFDNCATLQNKATASGDNAADASGSASIACQKPNLTVQKSGNGTVNAGEDVEFTIAVTNSGPGVARNVTLSDSVPSGVAGAWTISSQPQGNPCTISNGSLSCDFGDMAANTTLTVKVSAPTDADHCLTWNNTATASQQNGPDATDSDSVTCQTPGLVITKKGNGRTGLGKTISFTIQVANNGDGTAEGVMVNDELSDLAGNWAIASQSEGAGCEIVSGAQESRVNRAGSEAGTRLVCQVGDLQPGATVTVTVTGRMNNQACRTVNNTAIMTSTNAPQGEATATVRCVKPKLQLRKKANRKAVMPGHKVRYRVMVRNRKIGSVATNLTVCDRIPPHMTVVNPGSGHFRNGKLCWSIPRLEGSKRWTTFRYVAEVDQDARPGQRLRNVVRLNHLRARWTVRVKHPPVRHRRHRHSRVTG